MGLVHGHGVGEADVAGVDVPRRERDLAAGKPNTHRAFVGVDVDDHSPVAVADAESAVVAQRHHLVAGPDRHTCDVEGRPVEVAGGFGSDVAAHVEFGDVGAAAGEHDGVVTAHDRRPPVSDEQRFGVGGVVADGDASVVEVGVERVAGVAVAELAERFDLPLVLLTAVVPQLEHRQPFGQCGEQTAGGDLGELSWVADEDGLRAGALHVVEDAGEVACAGGAGLVDHEHRAGVESAGFVAFDRDQEPGDASSTGSRPPSTTRRRRRRCGRRRQRGSRRVPTRHARRRTRTSCRHRRAR